MLEKSGHRLWLESVSPMGRAISRQELISLVDSEAVQLVDVLPRAEYDTAHIPGAINIPLKTLNADTTSNLRSDKPVAVY